MDETARAHLDKMAEKIAGSGIKCPKCGEQMGLSMVSKLLDTSRMSFSISPHEGELLSARNVGGALEQMEHLLVSIGKDMGVRTSVLLEGMSSENGSVTFNLILGRHAAGVKKRKEAA